MRVLGLAATDDGEVRAECGERLCRRQPNAISGTRNQDLLVVHGTAIQGYGGARMTCSMVEDLALASVARTRWFGLVLSARFIGC